MNIIITNVGRRGYLADYFKELPEFTGKVFVSDCDRTASGLYGTNDGSFILPRPVDDPETYVNELIRLCRENAITVVIPVIDPEIYILSGYLEIFAKNGITVVVSDKRVLDICYDKLKMNEFLEKIGLAHPLTFQRRQDFEAAFQRGEVSFPVVLKPIFGSGSVDTYFVDDMEKVQTLFHKGMIIQEMLCGSEYGTDTFNSFAGQPLRCIVKKKILMRSGETDKSVSVDDEQLVQTLLLLAEKLGHVANLDCDIIVSNGTPYVIDMNPRFGGGYPATHAIGVNLVEILYHLLEHKQVKPEFYNYAANILVMKTVSVTKTIWREK